MVKLVCKRLTLVALSSRTDNRPRAMGCYLGGTAPVWQDSMSRAIQNAADQVTEPVNIADAYDLHRSLNTQWNSNLLLKDLHIKPGCPTIGSNTLAQLADWLFSQEPVRLTARFVGSWFIRSSSSNSATAYQMAMTLNTPWTVTLSSLLAVCSTKQSQTEGKLSLATKYCGCIWSYSFINMHFWCIQT